MGGIGKTSTMCHARTAQRKDGGIYKKKETIRIRRVASSSSIVVSFRSSLNPLLARLTQLHLATPLRLQHLARRDAPARIGVEDGVYDIPAACLAIS
jgi:hypothetical protein